MQRLTPLEIQKQIFGKSLHGFSVDEVRAYLHVVAEELERLLKGLDELSRDNAQLREAAAENTERERILKETLLSAQRVSEEVKANARKEAELIVKDAEILGERIVSQAMNHVGELERKIQELKLDRMAARNKLNAIIRTFGQLIELDEEQEATETPITHLHRQMNSGE